MPAAYAHYLFGKKVYHKLPEDIKEIIKENRESFWLGLHGPDLLFYYHSLLPNRITRQGQRMHDETAAPFFEKGRANYKEHPSYVLLSYLMGFICHFTLDSECHPYISWYMDEEGVSHSEIETDFDRCLIEESGHDPLHFDATRHLKRDEEAEEKIATMFDNITPAQVDKSIRGFHFYVNTLRCTKPYKEEILKNGFFITGHGHRELAGLLMHGRKNERCSKSTLWLREQLDKAVPVAVELITYYVRNINTDAPMPERMERDYK